MKEQCSKVPMTAAPGPNCPGPNCPPPKVDSWAPDSLALEQCINSIDICSPNISNTNIYIDVYITKCTFLNFVPEGRTETLQLTYIPQMLAAYIQYKYIILKMYIPQPCAQSAHRNSSTYIHPPCVGMIYPIPTYIFT